MNVELLEKVIAHIEEDPRRFHMDYWYDTSVIEQRLIGQEPPCGSIGCIGGWGEILAGRKEPTQGIDAFRAACEIFEISRPQVNRLCLRSNWPEPFRKDYNFAMKAGDFEEAVWIAVKRIRHFIETEGRDYAEA